MPPQLIAPVWYPSGPFENDGVNEEKLFDNDGYDGLAVGLFALKSSIEG